MMVAKLASGLLKRIRILQGWFFCCLLKILCWLCEHRICMHSTIKPTRDARDLNLRSLASLVGFIVLCIHILCSHSQQRFLAQGKVIPEITHTRYFQNYNPAFCNLSQTCLASGMQGMALDLHTTQRFQ